MKIIHFILGKANPDRMNGVNKVVNNLATTQHTLGYNVEVWGITDNLNHDYPERNYKTLLFKKGKNPFFINREIRKKINEEKDKTIFHLHGGFIPQYYTFSLILKRKKIPYIITSHGSYNKEALNKNKKTKYWYFIFLEKTIIKGAKHVHFIGKSEYEYVKTKVKKINRILIPNGQKLFSLNNKAQNEKLIFGFCGRLNMNVKGLDILFKGYGDFIKKTKIKTELWIIGSGDDFDNLIQLAYDNGIHDKVKFFGSKYGKEKNELIAKMDYFCHTSRYEGLPTSVLEASALSVPSIVSRETNMGEYLLEHKAGIMLEHNTPHNLSKAFHTVSKQSTKERLEYNFNAIQMVKKEFNWQTICGKLASYYFN